MGSILGGSEIRGGGVPMGGMGGTSKISGAVSLPTENDRRSSSVSCVRRTTCGVSVITIDALAASYLNDPHASLPTRMSLAWSCAMLIRATIFDMSITVTSGVPALAISPGLLDHVGWHCDPDSVTTINSLTRPGDRNHRPWRFGNEKSHPAESFQWTQRLRRSKRYGARLLLARSH